jgi:macrolide-specific efflux system membrane fusion protein
MDEQGQLQERKLVIGISNRVQVQVLQGLAEGEVLVSGLRQSEKPATAGSPMAPGAQGMGGARQLR